MSFHWLNSLFGVLFFGSLVFAGLTSVVSIVEPAISGIRDKLGTTRTTAVNWVCGLSFLISFLYATKGGINYLDLIDYFVNNYGLLLGAILMTIAVARPPARYAICKAISIVSLMCISAAGG